MSERDIRLGIIFVMIVQMFIVWLVTVYGSKEYGIMIIGGNYGGLLILMRAKIKRKGGKTNE